VLSGSFAEGVMPASNRVILTAARDDRPSFGCNAPPLYRLRSMHPWTSIVAGSRWWTVMENARTCIDENERALQVDAPSEPRASFGVQVTDLLVLRRGLTD